MSREAEKLFNKLKHTKKESIDHSLALLSIAGSYLSATFLPYHYERAFRLYFNSEHYYDQYILRRIIGGIGGVLSKAGQLFVGHKNKKKELARMSAKVLGDAYESYYIYIPESDSYIIRKKD